MTPRAKRAPRRVQSTGAEQTPTEPVTTEAAVGVPESTGAAEFDPEPVQTRVTHLDEPITVHSETPGPVTMTVGWLSEAETKVIEPDEPDGPTSAKASPKTKTEPKAAGKRGQSRDR